MKPAYYRTVVGAIFVGVVIVGVSILLAPALTHNNESNAMDEVATTKIENTIDTETRELIQDLQSQILVLSSQVEVLSERQYANNEDVPLAPTDDEIVHVELPESPPLVEDGTEQLMDHLSLIEGRFQSENTDNAWAHDVTSKVQYIFSDIASTNNSTLHGVECRTSVCKLSVGYESVDDLNNVRLSVVEKLGGELPYGAIQPGSNKNEVMIYLGKSADTFAAAPRY